MKMGALATLCAATAVAAMLAPTPGYGQPTAWTTNKGAKVTVIDLQSDTVIDDITLPAPFITAQRLKVNPAGTEVWVTTDPGSVVIIDIATRLLEPNPVLLPTYPPDYPPNSGSLVVRFSPDGATAYVGHNHAGVISVVDTATRLFDHTITLSASVGDFALTPDGGTAYICNQSQDYIWALDLVTEVAVQIPVCDAPTGLAITPGGEEIYAVCPNAREIRILDHPGQSTLKTITIAGRPFGVDISPDGLWAYVTAHDTNEVLVIDTNTRSIIDSIPVGSLPYETGFAPDSQRAYVTNFASRDLSVIDVATRTIVGAPIPFATGPSGIDVAPAVDSDGDGVPNDLDVCPGTEIPESVPTHQLGPNRWALVDGDGIFDTNSPPGGGPDLSFSIQGTAGCSCEQIIEAQGLGEGHEDYGCSISAMGDWVALVSP